MTKNATNNTGAYAKNISKMFFITADGKDVAGLPGSKNFAIVVNEGGKLFGLVAFTKVHTDHLNVWDTKRAANLIATTVPADVITEAARFELFSTVEAAKNAMESK